MFKNFRSLVGRLFSENIQMRIVMWLSDFFWFLRKYFLSVTIDYPDEFLDNWKSIKANSSQDKERNFTVYQLVKIYNSVFKENETNVIEFGVDRGGTLTTICNFIKPKTQIYALDSFGTFAKNIKENVTDFDPHYKGIYKPFTKQTRFKNFDEKQLEENLNKKLKKKESSLKIIKCHWPTEILESDYEILKNKKFSFVHFDFDLFKPTVEAIKFIKSRLTNNAIILFDDYNFLNQEGVKHAIRETNFDIKRSIQTQSGQLICWL